MPKYYPGDGVEVIGQDVTVPNLITAGNVDGKDVSGLATTTEAISAVEAAGLTFAENKGIILDTSLSADGKYSGPMIEAGTAGGELEFGEVVYQVAGDGEWELAKADVAATSDGKIGICIQYASGAAQPTTILLLGKVRADVIFPSFSVRRPVYISAATAGLLTTTAPTGTTNFVVRIVGYANTADELFFCPDNTYIELA